MRVRDSFIVRLPAAYFQFAPGSLVERTGELSSPLADEGCSATGVAAFVDCLEPAVLNVRIDLGRLHAGMAQHLLQGADLRAASQHVGRKAVP